MKFPNNFPTLSIVALLGFLIYTTRPKYIPLPTEIINAKQNRKQYKIDRQEWIKNMHRAGPGIDWEKMNQAISIIKDYEDFEAFSKSKTDVKTYLCNIISCSLIENENMLIFRIKANRFLRNMVRTIVGTLLEVGLGKIPPGEVHNIIKSKDRSKAGPSMPAHALFLTKIEYPSNIKL